MNQDWTYRKLGEACVLTMGQSPSSESYNKEGKGLPFFQGCSDFGKLNPTVKTFCNAPAKIAEIGDVLMSVRAPIGTLNIANVKCCIGRGLASFRALPNIDNMYLYYFLKHSNNCLQKLGTGSTFKAIGKESLYNFPIPVPPLAAQSRIVSELDLLQSIIDKQKVQLMELDNLAQAIFYDMFGDPVENEKGWEVKKLKDVGSIITGSTPSTSNSDNYASNDICFVKPSDIEKEGITTIKSTEFYVSNYAYDTVCRKLPKGSVLTTCIGIIGKVGVLSIDATCNQQINAVIPNPSMSSTYLAYAILSIRDYIQNVANAPVVPIINKGQFSSFQIPSPPLPLQQSFAQKIESIEWQKELINQSIREAQTLFDSRMEYYFGE